VRHRRRALFAVFKYVCRRASAGQLRLPTTQSRVGAMFKKPYESRKSARRRPYGQGVQKLGVKPAFLSFGIRIRARAKYDRAFHCGREPNQIVRPIRECVDE